MKVNKQPNQQRKPKTVTNNKNAPSGGRRTYSEDRRPEKIEAVQPPRPKPGSNKSE
tara:strand:+ start:363 stop:530 length:168 start_codon:yes stop_codon:yes gene_type:complete